MKPSSPCHREHDAGEDARTVVIFCQLLRSPNDNNPLVNATSMLRNSTGSTDWLQSNSLN